jgi:hypothetical protein
MPSESTSWQQLKPLLKGLDPCRVENLVNPGTPDINYIEGWIELKFSYCWPKRGGVLKIKHFTPQQRAWLTRRCLEGGKAFLILHIGCEWLLFNGMVAAQCVGESTREEMYRHCIANWDRLPTKEELQRWL